MPASLHDLLREQRPMKKVEPLHEALMADLADLCDRYVHGFPWLQGLPFKRGDVVTLRPGYAPAQLTGRPGVVVEVVWPILSNGEIQEDEGASTRSGRRADTRVVIFDRDHDMMPFWAESWTLATYTPS